MFSKYDKNAPNKPNDLYEKREDFIKANKDSLDDCDIEEEQDYFEKLYAEHDFRPMMSRNGDNLMNVEPTQYEEVKYDNTIKRSIDSNMNFLQKIADNYGEKVTHIKPHGALNNMACEDIELAKTLAEAINEISKDLIYLVPTGSKMEEAAKKLNMKIACEIFADRNYEDDGNLVSRKKPHALITNPELAKKHVLNMFKNQSLNCHSGKQIPCEIDSVCIHGDNKSSLSLAKLIRKNLIENGLKLKPLNQMKKFI